MSTTRKKETSKKRKLGLWANYGWVKDAPDIGRCKWYKGKCYNKPSKRGAMHERAYLSLCRQYPWDQIISSQSKGKLTVDEQKRGKGWVFHKVDHEGYVD